MSSALSRITVIDVTNTHTYTEERRPVKNRENELDFFGLVSKEPLKFFEIK